ncbi:MAG TPA: electron transfer flavoprotein subunit alpha/FixB family protein, partial [Croceibacterium sp.]|nr:electron transfer flavoprotein subunit alpha/FixB family protein [Croceibacterium sp.]
MTALVLVEHEGGVVKDATLAAVTAASQLGPVHALVAGNGAAAGVADAMAKVAGVEKVLLASDPAYEHMLPENVAPLAAQAMAGYDAFVAPATTTGKNIAPRVAALLDVMQLSEVIGIAGPTTFVRPIYAGNAIATVESPDAKLVLTVRATAFDKAAAEGGSAVIEEIGGPGDAGLSSFVALDAS